MSDLIHRFLTVTDAGKREKRVRLAELERRERSREILDIREVATKIVNREQLTPRDRIVGMRDRQLLRSTVQRLMLAKRRAAAEEQALRLARRKREKATARTKMTRQMKSRVFGHFSAGYLQTHQA